MDSVYDHAILEVGESGKFQRHYDIVYNGILIALWLMNYGNLFLVLNVPSHSCVIPAKPNSVNISESEWKLYSIPHFIDAAGQIQTDSCTRYVDFQRNNETKGCSEYEYDTRWYASTVASDNNWVCDKEIYGAHVFSYSRLAEAIGCLLFGWIGDRFGRRWAYTLSLLFLLLGRGIALLREKSFTLFTIGIMISNLPSWTLVSSVTVISLETTSAESRTMSTTLRNVSACIGMCIMPFIYWWLKEWKLFFMVTTATQIPFLLFSWKMIESPRWLWLTGKTDECIKTLKKIAHTNGRQLSNHIEEQIRMTKLNKDQDMNLSPHMLFSSWIIGRNTVCLQILWMSLTLSYAILMLTGGSSKSSEGNPFVSFAWQSAAELPANFVGALLADKLGRRHTAALSYGIVTIIWIIFFIRLNSTALWISGWWAETILFMINRFATTLAYYANTMINMELYPTCLRQSGMSMSSVFSSLMSASAPYILHLDGVIDKRFSAIVLILFSILAMVCSLILPETLNAKLPETLKDAQNFGKLKHRYSSVPVLHRSITADIQNRIVE